MTALAAAPRSSRAAMWLVVLAVVALVVSLLTPESPVEGSGGRSSYSTAPGGARMAYELADRLGWDVERRLATMDSSVSPEAVQVVLAPRGGLGGQEVHRLLENVRRGGGLIFSLDGNDELSDSLGVESGKRSQILGGRRDPACPAPETITARALLTLPPEMSEFEWPNRPPPQLATLLMTAAPSQSNVVGAVGFPLAAGRIAVTSNSALFSNEAVRTCPWKADLAVVRMLEYVRPRTGGAGAPRLVFDEFHHGFGIHGGTLRAAATYLAHTPSGHFVIQALVAGLLLLLAKAPRPIVPRDAARASRRSPLEHADALGRAYADVGATRTAMARLVGGLRRRTSRWIPVGTTAPDDAFFEAVNRRAPARAADVAAVRRTLSEPVATRDFASVGEALTRIEQAVVSSPSTTS
ncbi:MAG TPA: DUF4350 domain-containing protein [Gemmatimonadaceae bacterium]|nr:DUF4350 domain-containing protein [Gemmatimonadaceae bacterium]